MSEQSPWISTTPERIKLVIEDITAGSEPALRFYLMVVISTLIASIGLVTNSTAVIIGAMLVAPLMTPIFGISLGLLLGRPGLLGRALRAEIMGIIMAISIAILFGILPMETQVTPEMLARTHPNLLDLFVAIFAGLAGSYALVDERLSPSLPGVAIATAIVPPLANTGLCLSVGSYDGASGSFLLFLANFVSILLVAAFVFIVAGMVPKLKWAMTWRFVRRFALAVLGFLVITVILTQSLLEIIEQRRLSQAVNQTLQLKVADLYGATLEDSIFKQGKNSISVLATVRTRRIIEPDSVKLIETAMVDALEKPVQLVVRSILAADVAAPGSNVRVTEQNLDGGFIEQKRRLKTMIINVAEQVLREQLSFLPVFKLRSVDYFISPRGPTILANIESYRELYSNEIKELEEKTRARLRLNPDIHAPEISLIVSSGVSHVIDQQGPLLPGWSVYEELDQKNIALIERVEQLINKSFAALADVYPINFYFNLQQTDWMILVEVVGARVLTPDELSMLQKQVNEQIEQPVSIQVWSRIDVLVSEQGYGALQPATEKKLKNWEKTILQHMREKQKLESTQAAREKGS